MSLVGKLGQSLDAQAKKLLQRATGAVQNVDPSQHVLKAEAEVTRKNYEKFLPQFKAVAESRRSVKRFTDTPISDEVLNACLDLAMRAPSSSNLQPWQFVVIESPVLRQEAIKLCMNQNAAKTSNRLIAVVARTDTWLEHTFSMLDYWPVQPPPAIVKNYYERLVPAEFTTGPLNVLSPLKKVGVSLSRRFSAPTPAPSYSENDRKIWAIKSTCLAAQNLMLAFKAHGFDSCPMGGFEEAGMKKILGLGSHQHITMMIGAGERAEGGVYHDQFRFERERFIKVV